MMRRGGRDKYIVCASPPTRTIIAVVRRKSDETSQGTGAGTLLGRSGDRDGIKIAWRGKGWSGRRKQIMGVERLSRSSDE
ncbi:hypothetical protein CEXT_380851 [Caerostris extrusa]|uniref:Ribosomal protein L2 n=1 Tax=Caerostris extrusa TaxID=172846 RepID=A0AAV4M6Q9_CAEEX|nr:hypothetical protein CEXT_380851 [Caerostris extrusa]